MVSWILKKAAFFGPNPWSNMYYNIAFWKPALLMILGIEMSISGGFRRLSYPLMAGI
jgi:hypothetical protein